MKKRRQVRPRTLHCEVLESRQMMAASATLGTGGVLNVLGTDGNDQIKFLQTGSLISIEGVAGTWSVVEGKVDLRRLEGRQRFRLAQQLRQRRQRRRSRKKRRSSAGQAPNR